MKRITWHRLLSLLLVLALLGTACGSDGDDSDTGSDGTTDEPGSSTTVGPTVTLPEPDRPIEPLTGRDLGDEALLDQPAYAIKIDNDDRARPQNGLNQADVVFELLVEANKTRFLAVFHSDIPDEAGPTRSARSSDIDLVSGLGNPVFAFAGSNPGVASEINAAASAGLMTTINVDAVGPPTSFRDGERPAPHNLVSVPPAAIEAAGGEPGAPGPILAYRAPDEVGDAGPGGGIDLAIGSNTSAAYLWDEGAGGWARYQNDSAHLAHDGQQVAPTNVVVLDADYGASAADASSPEAITIGTGDAVIARNGEIIEGTWTRGAPTDPFQLTDADGELVLLDPGPTWLAVAKGGDFTVLSPEDAAVRAFFYSAAGEG